MWRFDSSAVVVLLFLSLFFYIILNNFISIFPYIFNCSNHIIFSLLFALSLWISFIIFGWLNNYNHIFIHLTPKGTPEILIFFIVIIEFIRNLIRPITLSVRLSANIIAGHLILILLRKNNYILNLFWIFIFTILQSILIILELNVRIIQGYVFSILSILYSKEIYLN